MAEEGGEGGEGTKKGSTEAEFVGD